MGLWNSSPPEPRSRHGNWATLLFSWWCTAFSVVIILTRLAGRKIRTGRLFREDKVMALSLIPLLARMGLVHVILLYGTNNVQTEGLTELEIHQRVLGSKLVLASRISYAMFIWVSKFTVSEFLKRLTSTIWRRTYELCLQAIRIFLVVTFMAVVIATLSECQPFDHYWQVVPDPGARCRQGYAQLLTMGTADIITDLLLIIFPIPIVMRSHMRLKRKLSLVALFSFSVLLIVITGMRMPKVIEHHGRQQYRTVWASSEILASAAVSNAVILGSFVRDRGVKRNKYRHGSTLDSIERSDTRRATLESYRRDSDENLFREIGCRMPEDLCHPTSPIARPAPAALAPGNFNTPIYDAPPSPLELEEGLSPSPHDSADTLRKPPSSGPSDNRTVAFSDVGGLLSGPGETRRSSHTTVSHDFATQGSRQQQAPFQPPRRTSSGILQEIGSHLSPVVSRTRSIHFRSSSRQPPNVASNEEAPVTRQTSRQATRRSDGAMDLQDVGGLLS